MNLLFSNPRCVCIALTCCKQHCLAGLPSMASCCASRAQWHLRHLGRCATLCAIWLAIQMLLLHESSVESSICFKRQSARSLISFILGVADKG